MQKILILNTTIDKGGAARVAYQIFNNLAKDFDIHFAYGRKSKKSTKGKTFYFGNIFEMYIHIFLVRFLGIEGFGTYFSTKKLIRYIKREKFDVVNMHNLHGYYLNFFMLLDFFKKSNIKLIYSLHDEWPITWLPAHSIGCSHCKTGEGVCTNTYEYPQNYFPIFTKYMLKKKREAFSKELDMTIVCPSVWLKNNIEKSFLNIFKIETIFNSIDTQIFRPTEHKNELRIKYELPLDKKIVLFSASNLNDRSKGIHYILEAAEILKDKNYLFVGMGAGTIKDHKNVQTTGYIYDKQKLVNLYALSDLFCFASAAETFLLSAAEALACAVPVVGFDLPVVRELVKSAVGILTKNDSRSLAYSIDKLLLDENAKMEMSRNGRNLVVESYSKEIFYKKYIELYSNSPKETDDCVLSYV